jgi:hypothetical protein
MHRSGRVLLLAVPFVLAAAVPSWPKESSDKQLVENKLVAGAMDWATADDGSAWTGIKWP